MVVAADTVRARRGMLQESYVLIERLKKMRALNKDPRIVGISPRLRSTDCKFVIVKTDKI
ncbi:MAG: hypothetical protein HQ572_01700 [Candidatus Omnitrophica bacterium]|nr:hypothetical protein [Candidatus Omnitrophota bacterium]